MSPEKLDETGAVWPNASFYGVYLGVSSIELERFLVGYHMESERVPNKPGISLKYTPDCMSFEAEFLGQRVVRPVALRSRSMRDRMRQ